MMAALSLPWQKLRHPQKGPRTWLKEEASKGPFFLFFSPSVAEDFLSSQGGFGEVSAYVGPCHFVLYCAHLCMKCSLGISNFLKEISSLSHSIVFLCFFALITEEGFLISLCYSLELHSDGYIFPFLLCVSLLFFSQLFVKPPQRTILPFCIFFFLGKVFITTSYTMSWTSIHSSSGTLVYQI